MRKSVFSKFVTLFGCVAFTFSSLFLVSCEIGMGESVDLEAPTIKLTKMVSGGTDVEHTDFDASIFCRSSVTFYGTAHDNEELTGVHAEIKWLGENSYKFLANATLDDEKWVLALKFPKEGACWLKIVAEDKTGNYGIRSSKVISLFVDNNAPSGNGWYIDRLVAGVQYNLQGLSTLKDIVSKDPNLTQPSNKDVAQNQNFKISANFSDASGIEVVSISIYDEAGNKIVDNIAKDTDSSNYAPFFSLSHDIITQNDTNSLKSGLHYLQVRYSAADTVTDPSPNTVEDAEFSLGWFIWWPESDNPKYSISGLESSGDQEYLRLNIGDSVNVTVFDDDVLTDTVKCVLKESGNVSPLTITETKSVKDGERELSVGITAPDKPMAMTLNITATASSGNPLNKTINVTVSDDSLPTLIIEAPENNQIPAVTGTNSEISFKGETLDKAGCTYLEFVWVPDSVQNKKAKAEAWLDSIENSHEDYAPTGSTDKKLTEGTGNYSGLKLWSAKLTDNGTESGFAKQTFNFKLKLLDDFENDKANDKYFLIRLTRKDGNFTDTEFKLSADKLKPEIKPLTPAGNMQIVDQAEDLYLMFYAEKESGLAMNESKYKAYYVDTKNKTTEEISGSMITQTINNKSVRVFKSNKIAASTLNDYASNDVNPTYRFEAEDILGNKNSQEYQIILSSLPTLKSIDSTAPSKCKKGDIIRINVSFSKAVNCPETAKLKLQGIKNGTTVSANDIVYADLESGNGSTTLVFKYEVKEGDESEMLQVYNEPDKGPIEGIISGAHLDTLESGKNLQDKRKDKRAITIDGVSPKVTDISITTDAESANIQSGISYLKAGRTITAEVTSNEKITVQGSPKLQFSIKDSPETLILNWQKTENDGKTLVFSKKIETEDTNGELIYKKNTCIEGTGVIRDDYGNSIILNLTGGNNDTNAKITIDTKAPAKPKISGTVNSNNDTNGNLQSGKYKNQVSFTITKADKAVTEYSTDGGTSWDTYSNTVTLIKNATLVAKTTDYAGNVSPYSDPIDLEVESTFPSFTVECTKPDGNYKAGTDLSFKVFFSRPVSVSSTSNASITLSDYKSGNHTDEDTKARLDDEWKDGKYHSEVTFTYQTRDPDEFTLQIAKDAIDLDGFTDEFGIEAGEKELSNDYTRPKLRCDGVAPKVISMTPDGSKGNNVYSNGKEITLKFSENIQKGSGNIYLRQVAGWAIPPVLTASQFNTICNAVSADDKNILSMQEDGHDMEDYEITIGNNPHNPNDHYYGTGQFVGPYKKSMQGLAKNSSEYVPDTSAKYVLTFDLDIWETDKTKTIPVGKTFTSRAGEKIEDRGTSSGAINANEIKTPTTTRSTQQLREVFEKAKLHERSLDVTSSAVKIEDDKQTVTINFPESLLAEENLENGRKWELVIEKEAFMDETGNLFGAEADGTIKKKDAVQTATGTDSSQSETFGSWSRGRTTLKTGEKPAVLIKNGSNEYFWSDKVATPVIRVDRYSYGYGMKQPKSDGSLETILRDSVIPTGLVRVRIDCETEGATIKYNDDKSRTGNDDSCTDEMFQSDNGGKMTYAAKTENPTAMAATLSSTYTGPFTGGTTGYLEGCKEFITAQGTKADFTASDKSMEGIYKTVIYFEGPVTGTGVPNGYAADRGTGRTDYYVRGTTGLAGEPYISPFPLRDSPVGSPFLRLAFRESTRGGDTYKNSKDYYWVSYEILVDSSYSAYQYGGGYYDWAKQWGLAAYGCFNRCLNMTGWRGN